MLRLQDITEKKKDLKIKIKTPEEYRFFEILSQFPSLSGND